MPRKPTRRRDRPETRDIVAEHWGLLGLLGGVCRAFERRSQPPVEQPGPHTPAKLSAPTQGKPPKA
jgi:hypothetical protein